MKVATIRGVMVAPALFGAIRNASQRSLKLLYSPQKTLAIDGELANQTCGTTLIGMSVVTIKRKPAVKFFV